MGNPLNRILIIDLEATCWDRNDPGEKGAQQSEIIEIGMASVNVRDLTIVRGPYVPVKPKYSKVSAFCTKLTGHTQEDLDVVGYDFDLALAEVISFCNPTHRTWMSWGAYDRNMLAAQMNPRWATRFQLTFSQSEHVDLRRLFTQSLGLTSKPTMPEALDICGLELEGQHHSGADDAFNTAKIYRVLVAQGRGLLIPSTDKQRRAIEPFTR